MCMCVYICICICICICIRLCIYVHVYTYVHVCMHVYTYVNVHVPVWEHGPTPLCVFSIQAILNGKRYWKLLPDLYRDEGLVNASVAPENITIFSRDPPRRILTSSLC